MNFLNDKSYGNTACEFAAAELGIRWPWDPERPPESTKSPLEELLRRCAGMVVRAGSVLRAMCDRVTTSLFGT